jgi:TP901 family phage tail tape measure protein
LDEQNRLKLKVGLTFSQTEAFKDFNKQISVLQSKVKDMDLSKSMGFKTVGDTAKTTNKELKQSTNLLGQLGQKAKAQFKNFAVFSLISGSVMFLNVNLRRAIETVSELDKAYTNFAIVTGATASEIERMDAEATKLTATLGRLKKEVIYAFTEFSRAGYAIEDAITLANNAIIGANVGFTSLANVTKFVIAGLKSFKLEAEDSARLIDVLFQVSNKTAIDFEGIGNAFLRSANTLQVAGASLEQSTALIAAANESIQDPAKVGTALKTIAARLRGVGDEGEVIPTLARDFEAVGVSIQNADGSFRNIYDIFKEFAVVYKGLDDLTKQNLVEKIAGKRQANIFIGLIENFETAEMALLEGFDSIGSAAEANEKYLESIEGRIVTLKNAVNELYQSILSSDFIKLIIEGLTNFVKLLDFFSKGIGAMTLGIGGLSASLYGLATALAGATGGLSLIIPAIGAVVSGLLTITGIKSSYSDALGSMTEDTDEFRESQRKLREELEKAPKDVKDQKTSEIKDITEQIEKLRELRDAREFAYTDRRELRDAKRDVENYNKEIEELTETLKSYGFTEEQAIEFLNKKEEILPRINQETAKYEGLLASTRTYLQNFAADTELTEKALADIELQGYLTNDMLGKLQEAYPELARETGLAVNKIKSYLQEQSDANSTLVSNSIDDLQKLITITEQKVALINAEREAWAGLGRTQALISGVTVESDYGFSKDASNLENLLIQAKARIEELKQSERERIDIIKNVNSESKNSVDTTEKVNTALTAQERILRDLNQQIAIKEREYSRAEGETEQLAINEELLELYKKLKVELLAQKKAYMEANSSITESSDGYDEYIDKLNKMSLGIEDATNSIYNLSIANEDLRTSMAQSVMELKDLIVDMIKQEMNDEIDSYKELIELAKEQLDLKLKQIEAEKDLADFAKDRENRELSISKLTNKIESLRVAAAQGDARAINELKQLEEQREKEQEELDKAINDRSFELRKENLENQFEEFEKVQNDEIKLIEENLNDASYLITQANQRMSNALSGNMDTLYQSLVTWNSVYGTGFEQDVLSKWEKAIGLVQQYNSQLGGQQFSFADFGNGGTSQSYIDKVKAEMRKNSDLWWKTQDEEERRRLNEKNKSLAKSIGYSFNSGDGRYYSDKDGSMLVYDNGGFKPKGVSGYMAEGVEEWVLKSGQIKSIQQMAIKEMFSALGNFDGGYTTQPPDVQIIVNGNIDDNNIGEIKTTIQDTIKQVSQGQLDAMKLRGFKPSVKSR